MPFNLVRHLLHTIFTVELEKLLQTCIERRKYPTLLNMSFLRTEKAGWISLVHRVKERFGEVGLYVVIGTALVMTAAT